MYIGQLRLEKPPVNILFFKNIQYICICMNLTSQIADPDSLLWKIAINDDKNAYRTLFDLFINLFVSMQDVMWMSMRR